MKTCAGCFENCQMPGKCFLKSILIRQKGGQYTVAHD